jgi:hypothetical protein
MGRMAGREGGVVRRALAHVERAPELGHVALHDHHAARVTNAVAEFSVPSSTNSNRSSRHVYSKFSMWRRHGHAARRKASARRLELEERAKEWTAGCSPRTSVHASVRVYM